ncbi:elongation factor G [Marinisporobacter balticus]|uniref:Elongation factor G n=1 Tax=Marinisporobacter balticus TaxID=2018667 RepID=A0A4R2KSM7_9FIRM|nr:elongation factor G [Marinisporobacter balticus]TCO69685.1 translation elongation factor 2 (EF-2/EF-G) [Marinisporobacter balticus]
MKGYVSDSIRNVALVGHGGCGKTILAEAMLYTTGVINRLGRTEDGNTVSDFDKQEIERNLSISTSLIPIEWEKDKYNLLDTPGYFDFVGEVNSALRIAGGAIIVVDASSGVEVGTEKAWEYTSKRNTPKLIFLNKMDKENVNYDKVIGQLREKFGKAIAPFAIPLGTDRGLRGIVNVVDMVAREYNGKECIDAPIKEEWLDKINPIRDMLIESVAESDEVLMEKYFEGEEFTQEEIHEGLRKGVLAGAVIPVLVGSAINNIGVHTLLNMIDTYMPTPKDMKPYEGINPKNNEKVVRNINSSEPFSALVFKTVVDPYVGKISLMKVISGELKPDMEVYNSEKDEVEKISNLFLMRGKNQIQVEKVVAGDIAAVAKLQYVQTGDTLCDKNNPVMYSKIAFPQPTLFMAVEPKAKGDEEKIGTGLNKLMEEDPSFIVQRNKETKQTLIGGQGDMHIDVITSKLKNKFGVDVAVVDQIIPYRETIKGKSDVQGKHKKQSGGHGQYGDVKIRFEPAEEEFVFEEEIFGGSVPRNYIPAVEKGLRECLESGVLAGFKVVNMKAILYDGSYHDVDSSEMAFKIAASMAFKKGIEAAKPALLEPIMHVEIIIPEDYMGDIMGDMNKRRGRILGMEPVGEGNQKVIAEAPQAELFKYATDLRSMTQARGSFIMEFTRYDEVPSQLSPKIIEATKERK